MHSQLSGIQVIEAITGIVMDKDEVHAVWDRYRQNPEIGIRRLAHFAASERMDELKARGFVHDAKEIERLNHVRKGLKSVPWKGRG